MPAKDSYKKMVQMNEGKQRLSLLIFELYQNGYTIKQVLCLLAEEVSSISGRMVKHE